MNVTPIVAAAAGMEINSGSNRTRVGRGVPDINEVLKNMKKCSCDRPKTIVFCRACGYYCNGRVRVKCSEHPNVTFLLDFSECPRCHSKFYLDEVF